MPAYVRLKFFGEGAAARPAIPETLIRLETIATMVEAFFVGKIDSAYFAVLAFTLAVHMTL